MNSRKLADRIGNIDERLVQQAQNLPNYGARRRNRVIKRIAACAATLVLMVCSFAAGMAVSANEPVVEPSQDSAQETVFLEEIGLTLILPDEWKDNYAVEVGEMEGGYIYTFYDSTIHRQGGEWSDFGILFWIGAYGDRAMTAEELEQENLFDGAIPYQYLFSNKNTNYIRTDVTDVQWDPSNPEMEQHYLMLLESIPEIRFILDNVL